MKTHILIKHDDNGQIYILGARPETPNAVEIDEEKVHRWFQAQEDLDEMQTELGAIEARAYRRAKACEEFIRGYKECAFYLDGDRFAEGFKGRRLHALTDMVPTSRELMESDARKFFDANFATLQKFTGEYKGKEFEEAGHYFWWSRNRRRFFVELSSATNQRPFLTSLDVFAMVEGPRRLGVQNGEIHYGT